MTFCCEKSGTVGRPTIPDFLAFQILDPDFQISIHLILAPWMPIAKPEDVVADALGAFPTTETTSSSMSSRAWRLGGRLLLQIRESLWKQFFVRGRTFKTIGIGSSATTCRGRLVSPVSYPTVSTGAWRLSVAFRIKPMRPFWVQTRRSPAILATMETALSQRL